MNMKLEVGGHLDEFGKLGNSFQLKKLKGWYKR